MRMQQKNCGGCFQFLPNQNLKIGKELGMSTTSDTPNKEKRPPFLGALFVIGFLCFIMFAQIFILNQDWVTHISLLFATVVCAIVALASGFTWDDIQEGILYGCEIAMLPMLILMMFGVLVASWISSGKIPTLVSYL